MYIRMHLLEKAERMNELTNERTDERMDGWVIYERAKKRTKDVYIYASYMHMHACVYI